MLEPLEREKQKLKKTGCLSLPVIPAQAGVQEKRGMRKISLI